MCCYPNKWEKNPDFLVVENFEFSGIDYCYTMCTIPINYTEAINSEYWVSAMQKEFYSFVENNTFELKKAPKIMEVMSIKPDLWPRATHK